MTAAVMSVAGGGMTVGGGAAVVVAMIADLMCMVTVRAERPVAERRMVAVDTRAAAGMVAAEAGVEPQN